MQARHWDVQKALLMFRNHVAWRQQYDMEDMIDSKEGRLPKLLTELRFPELAKVM